ncbi:hypothetical protein [Horticoccus sp. 23ND18S-11]|uniref:hypothetical protein n=1 Tax=Horticoccus sp. 23ND18S-11 TaxID=3391832 RepID=UPI0039C9F86F
MTTPADIGLSHPPAYPTARNVCAALSNLLHEREAAAGLVCWLQSYRGPMTGEALVLAGRLILNDHCMKQRIDCELDHLNDLNNALMPRGEVARRFAGRYLRVRALEVESELLAQAVSEFQQRADPNFIPQ